MTPPSADEKRLADVRDLISGEHGEGFETDRYFLVRLLDASQARLKEVTAALKRLVEADERGAVHIDDDHCEVCQALKGAREALSRSTPDKKAPTPEGGGC